MNGASDGVVARDVQATARTPHKKTSDRDGCGLGVCGIKASFVIKFPFLMVSSASLVDVRLQHTHPSLPDSPLPPMPGLLFLLLLCPTALATAALPSSQHSQALLQNDTASASSSSSTPTPAVNTSEVAAAVSEALRQQAVDLITLRTEFSSEGSSISVGEAYGANTLALQVGEAGQARRHTAATAALARFQADLCPFLAPLQFRFAVCTGTQLHHHSGVELMQAVVGEH